MDDTHLSRTSDAAAATRKRRSSILKSQRPPRTPFSELEFNVATPTDTAKSRRVSFSRRTGVAEFVTNEATTTWKNFYEEHNKSLESSGNESGANAPRPIGHIGKRIFDQQFQEVEAVDFGSTLDNHSRNINTSINNVNFTQQLASFEITGDDRKLTAPQQNFEMSAFTDHQSKLFGDDLGMPTMGETSGRIDINFSAVQTIGEVKDDLDEIQNDLQRAQSNVVCSGPFAGRRSLSEYIEVDLNATHVTMKNDEDDMSITDTIHSPKVQDISKNIGSNQVDKKSSLNIDWVADKENIALNPYVTPKESTNFAINNESDKILVFDGKRLTIQSDKEADKILKGTTDSNPSLHKEPKIPQRKTIVLNVNDDLPNFIDDPHMSTSNGILSSNSFRHSVMFDNDDDLTNENKLPEKRKTILYGNDTGNISTTQAIPENIIISENVVNGLENSKTVVFDNMEADISMTQVLPSKIIGSQENQLEPQRRRTILYDNDMGNISITQAIPTKIVTNENKEINTQKPEQERRRTILYDNDMGNISITQAIPTNIVLNEKKEKYTQIEQDRQKTILYDNDGNISITQAIPSSIVLNKQEISSQHPQPERRRTIIYDNDMGNISVTQAIPSNIVLNHEMGAQKSEPERRKTILYDNDMSNISMTQAIPSNIVLNQQHDVGTQKQETERRRTILYDNNMGDISITQAIPSSIVINQEQETDKQLPEPERRRTILFNDDMGNISVTQAIPSNIVLNQKQDIVSQKPEPERRKTIIYDNEMGNISVTQAIPSNIVLNQKQDIVSQKPEPERRKTILYDNEMGNISVTQAIPSNIVLNQNQDTVSQKQEPETRRTIIYDNDMGNMSVTQAIPANIVLNEKKATDPNKIEPERRRTILYDNNMGDISLTQAIPANIVLNEHKENDAPEKERKSIIHDNIKGNVSIIQAFPASVLLNDKEKNKSENDSLIHIIRDNTNETQTDKIPNVEKTNKKSIVLNINDDLPNFIENPHISTSNGRFSSASFKQSVIFDDQIPTNENKVPEKRKTILYENETGNISTTQALPANIIISDKVPKDKESVKNVSFKDMDVDVSMTKDLTSKIIDPENKKSSPQRRKTILYDNEMGNISMTQAVPVNIVLSEVTAQKEPENRRSMQDNDSEDISFTRAIRENIIWDDLKETFNEVPEKESVQSKSVTYDGDIDTVSSQAIPIFDNTQKNKLESQSITRSNSLIYIIRDTESETQTEDQKPNKSLTWGSDVPRIQHSPLSLSYSEDVDAEATADLPKKVNELKSLVNEKSPLLNRHYEKIVSPNIHNESESQDKLEITRTGKSFKDANDTNELLEMLSDLTDKRQSREPEKAVEKIETNEPRRLSIAPSRLSIVISREDLLNNISMAQAALQRSLEMDESIDETASETPTESSMSTKKTTRMSNEVVKKLQFEEDESASDASVRSDMKGSPLKKTAFGETSYMKESKAKVIPSYLKDVSDEIKALMQDLVKPNADAIPFQVPPADRCLKKEASTCSTQIQANLITSSQIDLETELVSATDSVNEMEKSSVQLLDDKSSHRSFAKSPETDTLMEMSFRPKRAPPSPPNQDRVIVFDHFNPLNNILLVPLDFADVHKYDPPKTNVAPSTPEPISENQSVNIVKEVADSIGSLNTQVVGNVTVQHSMQPSGDSAADKSDAQSLLSNTSKPTSIDESVSVRVCELKDTKVNTVIAMKGNKELLEASSSLTLVDDALAQNAFDVAVDMVTAQSSSTNNSQSPVKVIYHNEDENAVLSEKVDSDLTSNDEMMEPFKINTKGKKRFYSPTKKDKNRSAISSLDVTPKPISKMQKMSNSPKYVQEKCESPEQMTPEKDVHSKSAMEVDDSPKERKRSPRKSPKSKKPGTSVTVQQLLTKYDIHAGIDQEALNKQIIEALSRTESSTVPTTESLTEIRSPEIVSSFTSSKNQNEMKEACSVTTTESHTLSSRSRSSKEWQPEATNDSSTVVVPACESSVNVVAKIDMLPFMGSHECEWEASGIDTWSFRLLHARLRLSVRLAHRHDNATRTRVRADTPVRAVALDTTSADKKNSIASLCVGFAADAMRYFIGRGCSKAGDVPAMLRRCAGVARVALRWGRAMHEARLHLAYTLNDDGYLALKVANIPLRSVWEVTMRLELVVEDAREVPWPRACDVRVTRVVSDIRVPENEVKRAIAQVPRDWGHVPRAVWKIFRYLKNKTREDDLLGL